MEKLENTCEMEIISQWNNEERFERNFSLDGASDPLINLNLNEEKVNIRTHHKMGDGRSPYFQNPEKIDELVDKMKDKGFQIESTEGTVVFDDTADNRRKFYYYHKQIEIPDKITTVEELFNHIEKELNTSANHH